MKIITVNPNPDGSRSPLVDFSGASLPEGYVWIPAEFFSAFYPSGKRAAGFVNIEHDGVTVTACEWNEEAYQAWCAEHPEEPGVEPEPTDTEVLNTLLGVSE